MNDKKYNHVWSPKDNIFGFCIKCSASRIKLTGVKEATYIFDDITNECSCPISDEEYSIKSIIE